MDKAEEPIYHLVIGGIYRDDNDEPDYDGCYALCMGSNNFYFIFEGITHIQEIVEIACAYKMREMKGYALGIKKLQDGYEWQIRNSGKKNQPDYILAKGSCTESFRKSLDPFLKVFHK
jgi:hypothetical protein